MSDRTRIQKVRVSLRRELSDALALPADSDRQLRTPKKQGELLALPNIDTGFVCYTPPSSRHADRHDAGGTRGKGTGPGFALGPQHGHGH